MMTIDSLVFFLHPLSTPFLFTAGPQITVAVLHVTGVRKVLKSKCCCFLDGAGGGGGGVENDWRIQNHQRLYRMH